MYHIKLRRGIDDLKSLFAFRGNSQGDESKSNSIEEYKASKGWLSFMFDCELTDEAIAAEIEKRKLWNDNYLNELHTNGTYGEEYEIGIDFRYNPVFDTPNINMGPSVPLQSYRMVFLDNDKT